MNYYMARMILSGPKEGRYHYTRANCYKGVEPVGYCADDCPGHRNKDDAEEHYRQYMLDTARVHMARMVHQCEICQAETNRTVVTGPQGMMEFFLCEKHEGKEHLDRLLQPPGRIISSS